MTDMAQRGFDTFVDMQQEFLKMAGKQTDAWLNAVKTGKGFDPDGLIEMARDGMETFVHAQKKFLDVIAEQTSKATSEKESGRRLKKTELVETRQGSYQRLHRGPEEADRCGGLTGRGRCAWVGKTVNMVAPFRPCPFPTLRAKA